MTPITTRTTKARKTSIAFALMLALAGTVSGLSASVTPAAASGSCDIEQYGDGNHASCEVNSYEVDVEELADELERRAEARRPQLILICQGAFAWRAIQPFEADGFGNCMAPMGPGLAQWVPAPR